MCAIFRTLQITEFFIDVTGYLKLYNPSLYDVAMKFIRNVLQTTCIPATAGIGNMFLRKIVMDMEAKQIQATVLNVPIYDFFKAMPEIRLKS